MHKNPPVITTLDIHYMVINLWDDTVLPRLFIAHKRIKNAQPNRLSICSVIDLLNLNGRQNVSEVSIRRHVKTLNACVRRPHITALVHEHIR